MSFPYDWHPSILETQILRIGQLMIAAVPSELTTMSGRRFREALVKEANDVTGANNFKVVIAGLSNVYSHYVTTFHEYQVF